MWNQIREHALTYLWEIYILKDFRGNTTFLVIARKEKLLYSKWMKDKQLDMQVKVKKKRQEQTVIWNKKKNIIKRKKLIIHKS